MVVLPLMMYDVLVIFRTNRAVDIKGIDNHHVNNIGIDTVGVAVQTEHGQSLLSCTSMPY